MANCVSAQGWSESWHKSRLFSHSLQSGDIIKRFTTTWWKQKCSAKAKVNIFRQRDYHNTAIAKNFYHTTHHNSHNCWREILINLSKLDLSNQNLIVVEDGKRKSIFFLVLCPFIILSSLQLAASRRHLTSTKTFHFENAQLRRVLIKAFFKNMEIGF